MEFKKTAFPIIVLEGPDGAGKTTLAEALKKFLGARYIHLTYRFQNKMDLYHTAAIRLCMKLAETQPVILDRWWPSEIIYADAYRGGSKFIKTHFLLNDIAQDVGVVYVFCLPRDKARYMEHYNVLKGKRVEMYNEGLDRVYDGYKDFLDVYFGFKPNVVVYDFFDNYSDNSDSRDIVLSNVCQNVLEFTEDYRSTV